jgi:hypothetical protein
LVTASQVRHLRHAFHFPVNPRGDLQGLPRLKLTHARRYSRAHG